MLTKVRNYWKSHNFTGPDGRRCDRRIRGQYPHHSAKSSSGSLLGHQPCLGEMHIIIEMRDLLNVHGRWIMRRTMINAWAFQASATYTSAGAVNF
ncbi:hypothetical protein FD723_41150 (plasmid) [Nostoc sp. C052]|uniref:hypothetical protein n=1 Tax=Nostoc sp. C052 TaxID=2576902 RepID=UPI0015C36818|nr:hypothetical protein [Nostoc sp. C052]QLE46617.1 hypothetical protein FD723_41150 [Nostoc sp. C052]